MGLDNTWKQPGTDRGMLIPGLYENWMSFSGKLYERAVWETTGYSLHSDRILNEEIKEMAAKLYVAECPLYIPEDEWDFFVKMFRVYADSGAELVSSW